MSDHPPIDSSLVVDLYQSFQAMAEAKLRAQDAMKADQGRYAVFVPKYGNNDEENRSAAAREAAIISISQFYKTSTSVVDAGLLCASETTVERIRALNEAKKRFKAAVLEIRKHSAAQTNIPGKHIAQLLSNRIQEHGFRSEELSKVMSTAGISELDLKKCYVEIRIMPRDLDVFCWTWATKHSRTSKVSLAAAEKKVDLHFEGNPNALEINRRFLSQCKPGEMLVERVKLKNQLRANYGYWDNGEIKRASCPISGIVMVQTKKLPRYVWRDNPDISGIKPPQVQRVSTIDDEPLIAQLGLYRYVQP